MAGATRISVGDADVSSTNPIPVTVTTSGATDLGKAEDAAHASGDVGVAMLAVRRDTAAVGSGTDGDYSTVNVDGSGRVYANAAGAAAHDAAVTGNPVRIGARALTANYTGVATGDTADLVATVVGSLIQKPYSIPEADWTYAAAASGIVNTTTAVTIKAAGAAGLKNYITGIQVQTATLGAATELAIRDGAGGTVLWRTQLQTTAMPLTQVNFPTPLVGTAATLLEVVTLTAVTGGVYFNAQGYVAP